MNPYKSSSAPYLDITEVIISQFGSECASVATRAMQTSGYKELATKGSNVIGTQGGIRAFVSCPTDRKNPMATVIMSGISDTEVKGGGEVLQRNLSDASFDFLVQEQTKSGCDLGKMEPSGISYESDGTEVHHYLNGCKEYKGQNGRLKVIAADGTIVPNEVAYRNAQWFQDPQLLMSSVIPLSAPPPPSTNNKENTWLKSHSDRLLKLIVDIVPEDKSAESHYLKLKKPTSSVFEKIEQRTNTIQFLVEKKR